MSPGALDALRDEAIAWMAGGPAQPLIDAAAEALAHGIDSPTLRVLAGAPRASAEVEARELAERMFDELGIGVQPYGSSAAMVAWARLLARRFLSGAGSARELATRLYAVAVAADCPEELMAWISLDDGYALVDSGTLGDEAKIDADVRRHAQLLADP